MHDRTTPDEREPPLAGSGLPPAVRLHQLEGFFFVGVHQGFTRAAEAMPYPITEPALHQQVRKLERALGVKLLVRGPGRRMLLTPEGRALHRFVTPYFERLPAVLRAVAGGDAAELVVGSEPLYVEGLCAEVLARLEPRHPGAELRLVEGDAAELCRGVLRGTLDVAVAGLTAPPPGLALEPLGTLGLELLVPAAHPLAARRPPIRPAHLAEHRFALYARGTEARRFTEEALARAGVTLRPAAEASSAGALRAMARAGLAPAFVPGLGRARSRRRKQADGTVAFDLTEYVEEVTGELPRFGLLLREEQPRDGLTGAFAALARDRLGR